MITRSAVTLLLVLSIASLTTSTAAAAPAQQPPRLMENLGRGVVAIPQSDGKIFVAWRMLGTDPDAIAFNVYRGTP